MNNTSKVMLASGIVFGVGAIYAYKNDITFDNVLERLSENQDKFNDFIAILIEFSLDLLQRLFDWITELVRSIIFQIKLYLN